MKKLAFLLLLVAPSPAFAQFLDTFHVFPQFADGNYGPNTYYFKSTLNILPLSSLNPVNCSFNLRGMTARFESGATGSTFMFNIPAGGFSVARTTGTQPIQSGYATLTCSDYVYATVIYTYWHPSGFKVGEATVFSGYESFMTEMIFDHSEGARLGIAVANDTDLAHVYDLTVTGSFGTRVGTRSIPPRGQLVGFIDDIITGIPPGAIGRLKIQAKDFSDHYVIGLRFTGTVFTTIPAN